MLDLNILIIEKSKKYRGYTTINIDYWNILLNWFYYYFKMKNTDEYD
jgi:hypothetical protein